MANLRETAEWAEGIYQIEKTDPVVGGEDGISNRQAQQLGNRTAYLKKEVEKRATTNNPAFTGAPTAPTPGQSTNNQQIATTEFVKTAIAALVGSAPAALDTLAELATALGNDSNLKQVLLTEIGKKANASHTHTMANITDLAPAMNAKANLASPTFTGAPKAPTPDQTVNDTTLATTAFVKTAIAALVGSAPAALDTLAEIATALGNDGNVKQVLLTEIGKKANLTDFTNLKNLLVGIPFPYPLSAVPSGCLAFNGQTFSKSLYPELAKKYPSGKLPDLRGEFIRGWDNGRGVDGGRGILSEQGDAIRNITGGYHTSDGYGGMYLKPLSGFYGAFHSEVSPNGRVNHMEGSNSPAYIFDFDASRVVPTADENRPRNIAFQYICLAK